MVKHSHRRLPNERAADFIHRCRQIITATIIKWLCNTATVTSPIFLKLIPAEILVSDSLCNIFDTYNNFIIYIALHAFKSLQNLKSQAALTQSSRNSSASQNPTQPSIPLQTPPSSAPITPAMSPIPQDISDIHVLLLLKMQPWSPWRTIMDIILVTTCQNLRMISWGTVWERKNMMKLSQPKRLVLRLRLFSAH